MAQAESGGGKGSGLGEKLGLPKTKLLGAARGGGADVKLKCLRLIDRLEAHTARLFDEFSHLPNAECHHASLEQDVVRKDADCLVLPIYANEFQVTPILKAASGLFSPAPPEPSIIDQLHTLFDLKSYGGHLPPNEVLMVPIGHGKAPPHYLLAVTIWKSEAMDVLAVEMSIQDAFRAVLNKIQRHNRRAIKSTKRKSIKTLIAPTFLTAGVPLSTNRAASLMASVYREYLLAHHVPITNQRCPKGEEVVQALRNGIIKQRGLGAGDDLLKVLEIMLNLHGEHPQQLQDAAIEYVNYLLARPQNGPVPLHFTRDSVLQSIREVILMSSPCVNNPSPSGVPASPNSLSPPPGPGSLPGADRRSSSGSSNSGSGGSGISLSNSGSGPSGSIAGAANPAIEALFELAIQMKFVPYRWLERHHLDVSPGIIGRGAFGKVKKAKLSNPYATPDDHKEPKELMVALKEFDGEIVKYDPILQKEIVREATIMTVCKHPRLLQCRGVHFGDKDWWLTMDLADCDLRTLLNEEGEKMPGERRLRIALQIAEGILELHRLDLIHRDLKSPNILIIKNGYEVKIADFGLCRVVNRTMTTTTGTPLWRAPEAIGRGDYTKRADVFSFGIILWEILTGDLPYRELEHETAIRFDDKIINGHRPGIPTGFENHPFVLLMVNCWHPNPKERQDFISIVAQLRKMSEADMPNQAARPRAPAASKSGFFSWYKRESGKS